MGYDLRVDPLGALLQRAGSFRARGHVESLWVRTTGRGTRLRRLPGGAVIACDLAIPYERNVWLRREEERDLELLRSLLTPDDTFLDCGANVGLWTLTAAPIARRVIGVEPNARVAARLRANIEASALANVTVVEAALGAAAGRGFLDEPAEHNASRLASAGREVAVTTIDEILGGDRVTAIKLDVEGSEHAALRGAAESIARWRPWLVVELNTGFVGSLELDDWDVHRALVELGYATDSRPPARLGWYANLLYRPVER